MVNNVLSTPSIKGDLTDLKINHLINYSLHSLNNDVQIAFNSLFPVQLSCRHQFRDGVVLVS
jgi:hypothetical protein